MVSQHTTLSHPGSHVEYFAKVSHTLLCSSIDEELHNPLDTAEMLLVSHKAVRTSTMGLHVSAVWYPAQVLVVPRKLTGKVKPPVRTKEREASDEEKEPSVAPMTPDRSNSSAASTFSSPHSSIYSPHHLSRPYAQVSISRWKLGSSGNDRLLHGCMLAIFCSYIHII